MSDDLDNESEFGRVTWLSSEEDGGPDVGVVLGLGEGRSLFIGELPNITLQEHGLDPNDGSWWLSMYEPDDHIILGPVRNEGRRSRRVRPPVRRPSAEPSPLPKPSQKQRLRWSGSPIQPAISPKPDGYSPWSPSPLPNNPAGQAMEGDHG